MCYLILKFVSHEIFMHRLTQQHLMNINRSHVTLEGYELSFKHILLALFAGVANALSISFPFSSDFPIFEFLFVSGGAPIWWLQVISLSVLSTLLTRLQEQHSQEQHSGESFIRKWAAGALIGWVFCTAWLACTFWWTFVALHTYGGLPALLGVIAVVGLAALLGLYYAVVCGLFVLMKVRGRYWVPFTFGLLWLFAELARGVLFTGFGWGAVGYAHSLGPLSAYAPWIGVYGLCFISAWLAMTLVQRLPDRLSLYWRPLAGKALLVVCVLGLPTGLSAISDNSSLSAGRLEVTLLQGNIPQDEKFEVGSGVPLALQWYADELKKSKTALVVAPETSLPLLPQQMPLGYWDALKAHFSDGQQAALIGMPLGNAKVGYTNSVVGLKAGQTQPWRYDKHHLVPFGEFIPPLFKWFTELMHIPLGDFNRGSMHQASFEWRGQRLATNICYEDLFGEELGLQFSDPRQAPTIFVNVSNLAWFGDSVAMDQHLQIARMRALEFERPFVLATNTGVTAIVDHRGHVVSSLPRNTRGVLVGEVEGRTGITPFAAWVARFGLWPYWLLACSGVGFALRSVFKKPRCPDA